MMDRLHTLTPEEIGDIQKILEEGEKRRIVCERELSGFWFHDDVWESEFRILFLANFRLTISRVNLINKRKGTMTKLFEYLGNICEKKGIADIVVQCVETREMAQWCRKHEFLPISYASFLMNGCVLGDYKKHVI